MAAILTVKQLDQVKFIWFECFKEVTDVTFLCDRYFFAAQSIKKAGRDGTFLRRSSGELAVKVGKELIPWNESCFW